MDQNELERLSDHEVQHVLYSAEEVGDETLWLFVFSEEFKDIYKRMKSYYDGQVALGVEFKKGVGELPTDYASMETANTNYVNPDELLAMLRAYKKYLEQAADGKNPKPKPYEFIEAFKEGDVKWLDVKYRSEIVRGISSSENIKKSKPRIGQGTTKKIEWG